MDRVYPLGGSRRWCVHRHFRVQKQLPENKVLHDLWILSAFQGSCPLALNLSIYKNIATTLANESGVQLFAPTTFWEEDGMQANKTVVALLLSELHANTSLFDDKKPLIDLRVL